jgi:hypothetical protein
MSDSITDHPAIHWFFLKWPKWVKIATAIVGFGGIIGSIMGWGGQVMNAFHAHDAKVQAETEYKLLDKQRDDKVDATLVEHGKAIAEVKTGVQDIQTHLSKQDVDALATKQQLNIIETAILNQGAARVSLPPLPTPILTTPTATPHG